MWVLLILYTWACHCRCSADQGGILFNLGKALTTVGRFEAANEVYATTAIQAYGHDISSYSKALAAMQTLDAETAASAAWVAAAARGHVRTLAGFKFLKYMKLKDASAKKNSGDASVILQHQHL
jgi:hypothetical protein